ncbi:transposase [Actinomycetes bacterium NPDC127524]
MTQLQFNLNMDTLKEAVVDSNLDMVMKSALVLVLNEFMEKERDDYLQAGAYERTVERRDQRNGYYKRELLFGIGKLKLKVPRTRNGEFSPTVFEKYARCDQALVIAMLELTASFVHLEL